MGETSKAAMNEQKQRRRVYIWDMDETLILLKSLLNGTYAESLSKDPQKGFDLGKQWEKSILQIADDFFFYKQVENYNSPTLDAFRQCDDGRDLSDYGFSSDGFSAPCDDANRRKLAYRYRVVANKYKQGLLSVLGGDVVNQFNELYDLTDDYTDGWFSSARIFLEQCSGANENPSAGGINDHIDNKPQHINVLVTSGSLIPSLIKCILFRLDNLIPHENVYSSLEVGKTQCFQWIKERFHGPNVQFCAIGDGWEESEAARVMSWPFIQIDLRPSGYHRFPGLAHKTVGYYFDVVYGSHETERNEDE